MFGKFKNNFAMNQMVLIGQTGSPSLDGVQAQVIGIANEGIADAYILLLPEPINHRTGIVMTEVCLKAVIRPSGQHVYGEEITC